MQELEYTEYTLIVSEQQHSRRIRYHEPYIKPFSTHTEVVADGATMRHLDVLSYDLCLDPCCTWDFLSPYTDRNLKGAVDEMYSLPRCITKKAKILP